MNSRLTCYCVPSSTTLFSKTGENNRSNEESYHICLIHSKRILHSADLFRSIYSFMCVYIRLHIPGRVISGHEEPVIHRSMEEFHRHSIPNGSSMNTITNETVTSVAERRAIGGFMGTLAIALRRDYDLSIRTRPTKPAPSSTPIFIATPPCVSPTPSSAPCPLTDAGRSSHSSPPASRTYPTRTPSTHSWSAPTASSGYRSSQPQSHSPPPRTRSAPEYGYVMTTTGCSAPAPLRPRT